VVIHEPDKSVGYYGADVSGPVFKKIAQKIYSDVPTIATIDNLNLKSKRVERAYEDYYEMAQSHKTIMPNLKGMPAMDAIAILENMGLNVTIIGRGIVRKQSVGSGQKVTSQTSITLELS
jgi:cell division protein FtsI (penicillin-binding protein 3)